MKDEIFKNAQKKQFEFDASVASVFAILPREFKSLC